MGAGGKALPDDAQGKPQNKKYKIHIKYNNKLTSPVARSICFAFGKPETGIPQSVRVRVRVRVGGGWWMVLYVSLAKCGVCSTGFEQKVLTHFDFNFDFVWPFQHTCPAPTPAPAPASASASVPVPTQSQRQPQPRAPAEPRCVKPTRQDETRRVETRQAELAIRVCSIFKD